MNGLDLFSGIGGLSLALSEYVRTVAYCEINKYCQAVLLSRMHCKELDKAPIWDDIRTLTKSNLPEIDIIFGGFPCQDISCAGLGKGLESERSGLFYEIKRLCSEIKPRFVFLENVPAITSRGGTEVVREIASLGYDCRWCIISAASIGALHKRERWFLLAHSNGKSSNRLSSRKEEKVTLSRIHGEDGNFNIKSGKQTNKKAESFKTEQPPCGRSSRLYWPLKSRTHWQETVSSMDKCSDGILFHMDRLRALGNSVVPEQAKVGFKHLMGLQI